MLCGVCVVGPHALNSTGARAAQLNSRLLCTCEAKGCLREGHGGCLLRSYVSTALRLQGAAWLQGMQGVPALGYVCRMVCSTCRSRWGSLCLCSVFVVGNGCATAKAYLSTCVRLVLLSHSWSAAGCSCLLLMLQPACLLPEHICKVGLVGPCRAGRCLHALDVLAGDMYHMQAGSRLVCEQCYVPLWTPMYLRIGGCSQPVAFASAAGLCCWWS